MKVTTDLAVTNIDSIKLQVNTLAQLTEATNELTRAASVIMHVFLPIEFRIFVHRCSPRPDVIN